MKTPTTNNTVGGLGALVQKTSKLLKLKTDMTDFLYIKSFLSPTVQFEYTCTSISVTLFQSFPTPPAP